MEKFYASYGYINFVETPVTEVDDATQRISLLMELDEGKQFRVGKVEVFGLEASKAAMLTSALQTGDVFNRSLVDDFVEANMSAQPEGASRHVLDTYSDERQGTVDMCRFPSEASAKGVLMRRRSRSLSASNWSKPMARVCFPILSD